MKFIIYYIIFSLLSFEAISQRQENDLINFTQEDGLPSNETYCIFKDSKNYIWIASDQGVVRTNGTNFKVIKDLPDNVVFKIKEDKEGRIWFFSRSYKLCYFFNEKLTIFKFNDRLQKHINISHIIHDAFFSAPGIITLRTWPYSNYDININTGAVTEQVYNFVKYTQRIALNVYCLENGQCFLKKMDAMDTDCKILDVTVINGKDTARHIVNCNVSEIPQFYNAGKDKNGNIYLFMGKVIVKLFPDGSSISKEIDKQILCIYYNKVNDKFLIGLRAGGIRELNSALEVTGGYDDGMNKLSISSIAYDFEGSCWVTTLENGAYYFKNNLAKKLFNGSVSNVAEHSGDLIFGKNDGVFKLTSLNKAERLVLESNKQIYNIIFDSAGNLTLAGAFDRASLNHLVYHANTGSLNYTLIYTGTEITDYKQSSIYRLYDRLMSYNRYAKNSFIWDKVSLPYFGIPFIDSKKRLLLTGQKALYKFDSAANLFKEMPDPSGYFSKGISCIKQMNNETVAIGGRFNGVILMRGTTVTAHITELDGLADNSIKYILPDNNDLWVATTKGISVISFSSFTPLKYKITNFGEEVGLNNCVIYQFIKYKNSIIIATSKGILQLSNIDVLLQQKLPQLPLYITSINYYKGDTSNISSIELPYDNNSLTVNFNAICYNEAKAVTYYYRLNSTNDTLWRTLTSPQLVFEKLEPGTYQLQIKASLVAQNRYSTIQSLTIIVKKPWWQLNVVRALFAIIILGIFFLLYYRRIKIIRKKEEEKSSIKYEILELKQTALRSQMNPHFIFNCLTSIQHLLMYGNKKEANEYLVKFSRLIRKTLELSTSYFITLEQEKGYLEEYLELEQLRIPGKFDFLFTLKNIANPAQVLIPNMMLQPLIENSIRHGVKHLTDKKGEILIEIEAIGDCLRSTITDNGIGRLNSLNSIKLKQHKSFGMDIIQKILISLPDYNPHDHFLKIEDILDKDQMMTGTKVILQIPLKLAQ